MMPLVYRIMKATASGVARSAAMIRSPSFSRSSSSMMTTMRPARRSARISSMEFRPEDDEDLLERGSTLDMADRQSCKTMPSSIPDGPDA